MFDVFNNSDWLLEPLREHNPDYSILDLKSRYRGYRYATETIKMGIATIRS